MTSTPVFTNDRGLFAVYDATLTFRSKLMGGIPKSPDIIEGWLRSRAGVDDQKELHAMMIRTLVELGAEVTPEMTYEQLIVASKEVAAQQQSNGFKRDDCGLYIEDRQIKALIKENVNILYAGQRWGPTRKGPRNFTAERVFVDPERIHLGRQAPDGMELQIVHVSGPQGPRSSLTYVEYVEGVEISFTVEALRDEVTPEQWAEVWYLAGKNGLGAARSQSYGRFDVTRWERRE